MTVKVETKKENKATLDTNILTPKQQEQHKKLYLEYCKTVPFLKAYNKALEDVLKEIVTNKESTEEEGLLEI